MNPSDSQIQRDVLEELRLDARLDGANIDVEVMDGWVILSGSVSAYAQDAALDAARCVVGVVHVGDDLTLIAPDFPDSDDTVFSLEVMRELECDILAAV